jgi:hypothetical protein
MQCMHENEIPRFPFDFAQGKARNDKVESEFYFTLKNSLSHPERRGFSPVVEGW